MTPPCAVVERAITLSVGGDALVGILSPGDANNSLAVLVIVGGPQYRIGSHRQFVHLSRTIAAAGPSVLRYDYRGCGDSDGGERQFDSIEADIAAGVDYLMRQECAPQGIALVGLCDAACAALMYAPRDPRVVALVLLNPDPKLEQVRADAFVKHYYAKRLLQGSFWRKIFSGRLAWRDSWRDAWSKWRSSRRAAGSADSETSVHQKMLRGMQQFAGATLIVLSGRDLTAREFEQIARESQPWREALMRPKVRLVAVAEADHTFSTRAELERANATIAEWTKELAASIRQNS